jgi:hypothetical protein
MIPAPPTRIVRESGDREISCCAATLRTVVHMSLRSINRALRLRAWPRVTKARALNRYGSYAALRRAINLLWQRHCIFDRIEFASRTRITMRSANRVTGSSLRQSLQCDRGSKFSPPSGHA